jgi:AcrR family transcriptional regulator
VPRQPDPALEERIVAAALRLLDRGGEATVTMRATAREAGTTTPTLYERFSDREVLMKSLVDRATGELILVLRLTRSIEGMFRAYLREAVARPMRMELMVETFAARHAGGEEMPAFDLLKQRLREQLGVRRTDREDLALAIASLAFGTARGIIAAGTNARQAAQFQRSAVRALKMLMRAFAGDLSRSRAR